MDSKDIDVRQNKDVSESENKVQETAIFKTPSFVIPSKNKVQNKQDTPFNFKTPDSLLSKLPKGKSKDNPEKNKQKEDSTKTECPDGINQTDEFEPCAIKSETRTVKSGDLKDIPLKPSKPIISPAEQLRYAQTAVPYKEPPWSMVCTNKYALEVIKNGSVIEKIDMDTKAFYVVGRLPSCDIPMEHPSMSRYHAVLQYSNGSADSYPKGWYLFDLDSTHGTWINKNKVLPLKYHQIHVDFCLKFGGSTRLFILEGPDEDREEESELSVKEMMEQREKQKKEAELLKQAEIADAQQKAEILKRQAEARGCTWGINEEETEEEDSEENPFAVIDNEELYIDDPKKSLNGYFEREGLDPPQYEFSEAGFGKWKCSVELPLDTSSGEPMVAEVVQTGKKREAVIACALEACRILDRHGVLRQSTHESKKRKQKNWEQDDFYDSDEDVYLDRTGTIEKKREIRKGKAGKSDKKADTYESLMEKHSDIIKEMKDIESQLEHAKAQAAALENDDVDALDAYMSAIKSGMMDTRTKMSLKRRMMELKQEEQKVRKLINVAKPASLPELNSIVQKKSSLTSVTGSVGRMKGAVMGKQVRKQMVASEMNIDKSKDEDEKYFKEEMEENDEDLESENNSDQNTTSAEIKYAFSKKNQALNINNQTIPNEKQEDQGGSKVKDPAMPLAAVLEKLQNESLNTEEKHSVRKTQSDNNKGISSSGKKREQSQKYETAKRRKQAEPDLDLNDPEYASWIPPENQAGDGKTHLNAKFGY